MVADRRWVRDSNMDAGSFGKAAGDYSLAVTAAPPATPANAPIRTAMCDTSAMTIVLIAIALYLLAAIALVVGAMRGQHPPGHGWLLPALPAVALHAGYHVMAWRIAGGADLRFFSALSLVGLGMARLAMLDGGRGRMATLGVVVFPIAAATLAGYAGYRPRLVEAMDTGVPLQA